VPDIPTELTKTELRICAFLKMNLTSKEVAAIINTSPLTINSHRYSIRKKLGLDSKDSIFEFLQQL
jgi:DNA-binding CsgD family transcriptional regulator